VDLSRCIEDWSYDFMVNLPFYHPAPTHRFVQGRFCIWTWEFAGECGRGEREGTEETSVAQELMRNGDPENLVKNGKTATALFDMYVKGFS
jgi:hypothetical protein